MSDVVLAYYREGARYVGHVELPEGLQSHFDTTEYAQMLQVARDVIGMYAGSGLVLQRTDRPGLLPVKLSEEQFKLLVDDFSAYIAANTIPSRIVNSDRPRTRASALTAKYIIPSGIDAGYATLGQVLGDDVYFRRRADKVEHPVTGRWVTLEVLQQILPEAKVASTEWVKVPTAELLRLATPRFYLPRAWNVEGRWILHETLRRLFNQYKEEKSNVI